MVGVPINKRNYYYLLYILAGSPRFWIRDINNKIEINNPDNPHIADVISFFFLSWVHIISARGEEDASARFPP